VTRKPARRPLITETTSTIGTGPLLFDADVARAHGWTEEMINRAYPLLAKIVGRAAGHAQRRRPDLYRRHRPTGVIMFVGAIKDSPALKLGRDYERVDRKK